MAVDHFIMIAAGDNNVESEMECPCYKAINLVGLYSIHVDSGIQSYMKKEKVC